MSKVKDLASELYDAGDGVADMDALQEAQLQEAQERWELEKLKAKYEGGGDE